MAAAYDIPVVPHASGAYSYHFVHSQPHIPYCEYVNASPAGDAIEPTSDTLFDGDDIPENGKIRPSDRPGFGMTLRRGATNLTRPFLPSGKADE